MDRSAYTTYEDMYREPLEFVRADAQYCYDKCGKKYTDLYNNVFHVGHSNQRVIDAVHAQMSAVNLNIRYVHPLLVEYSRELLETFPRGSRLDTCFFVNSGSEANDLAMRLAKTFTNLDSIYSIRGGYHGTTDLCACVSTTMSTGAHKKNDSRYILERDHIPADFSHGNFIHETIQGVGGQVVYSDNFLPELYKKVKKVGGLCIADEVQTGFGRMGDTFWAFQHYNLSPDIVTLGKAIGNGYPLGCVVTRREIAECLPNYFNTYGGNPVACAAGLTTLRIIKELNLQGNAQELGEYLIKGLREIFPNYEIRGWGFFVGVVFPTEKEAVDLFEHARKNGFLLGVGGEEHNVLRIKPPMVINKSDIDGLLGVLCSNT